MCEVGNAAGKARLRRRGLGLFIAGTLGAGWLVATGVVACRVAEDCSTALSRIGLVHQLLGLLMVALGFADMRERFSGYPGLLDFIAKAGSWALRAVRRSPGQTIGLAGQAIGSSEAFGELTVRKRPRNTTVEQRVGDLEEEVDRLHESLRDVRNRLTEEARERRLAVQQEGAARGQGDRELRERVTALATASVRWQGVGAVAIAIGIVLTTTPELVAEWVP